MRQVFNLAISSRNALYKKYSEQRVSFCYAFLFATTPLATAQKLYVFLWHKQVTNI
jgi:hypothetical protein